MQSRLVLYGLVAVVVVGGFAFAADALHVSDEEQLEEVASALTDGPPAERVSGVMRWVDPSREAVGIQRDGTMRWYEDDNGALSDALLDSLGAFEAPDLEVVQRSVQVREDRATVALRARADGEVHDATLHLVRNGQGWLLERVHVL